ncbi:MAG: acetate kinase [Pyrinomonas sp.]|uniref:acetate kinase n=1 Tax=Pyrinomonas sp. TaxID=2080306 RepID=UPI0033316080
MNVLVLNCGSSSVKFQLIATDLDLIARNADRKLARGMIERIGGEAIITFRAEGRPPQRFASAVRDHRAAIEQILRWSCSAEANIDGIHSIADIHAVGHRVVHGGERFARSLIITEEVLRGIEDCIDLAPLHNPANIRGIMAAREALGPGVPQVAVFDTAFHQTLPEHAYLYALPYQLYRRHRIRRYGFHGTSHRYVAYRYRTLRGITREQTDIITLHLGNGCSATAIKRGQSIDTSMGLTPLEGLVMGTRSGDIDPAIVDFLAAKEGLTTQEVEMLLNKQSGLLGISGLTNDMRELLDEAREHDDRRARLAIEIFCYRARKYIGAYLAAMGGADAVIFTGGIGENAPDVRARICFGLDWTGLELDQEKNLAHTNGKEGIISRDGARLAAYVIPTDEELLIARDTVRCVFAVEEH